MAFKLAKWLRVYFTRPKFGPTDQKAIDAAEAKRARRRARNLKNKEYENKVY